ncbi:hypothetical protein [Stackebrandtia nassauensis]|uniref:Uncharacterized protein n=1 Tax=Stackebrandtia nassauensis (strain DSM 44728 / CIP 108903 / NRRL B-16338 / NBRC 102104 / LLR-40K-21) TaxID=446470 RepID=D3PWQ0_STANL|nr:hypothetical protein [Stackebrandtia nassauensis]ADD43272.1 hypothetical protein Snas_3612 [Stackebrandtia nassauensis DSM 44728]
MNDPQRYLHPGTLTAARPWADGSQFPKPCDGICLETVQPETPDTYYLVWFYTMAPPAVGISVQPVMPHEITIKPDELSTLGFVRLTRLLHGLAMWNRREGKAALKAITKTLADMTYGTQP